MRVSHCGCVIVLVIIQFDLTQCSAKCVVPSLAAPGVDGGI